MEQCETLNAHGSCINDTLPNKTVEDAWQKCQTKFDGMKKFLHVSLDTNESHGCEI